MKRASFVAVAALAAVSGSGKAWGAWTGLERQGICHAMHFVDGATGYAIGASLLEGNILQKWNGTQWATVTATGWSKGFATSQLRLFFVDSTTGFSAVSGSPLTNFLQKTTNSGAMWTARALTIATAPPNPESKVEGISFATKQDGVAIGWVSQGFVPTNGKIFVAVTHDGGDTWATVPAPTDATYLYGGAMLGPSHIVAYGYQGTVTSGGIWVTKNAGTTWTKARSGNRPSAVDFLSPTVGYAWLTCAGPGQGALDKCISKTTDGGETWTDLQTGYVTASALAMKFADENDGLISAGKEVFRTTNGGTTWTADVLPAVPMGNLPCLAYPGPAAFLGAFNGNDKWLVDGDHGGGPKANLPGGAGAPVPSDGGVDGVAPADGAAPDAPVADATGAAGTSGAAGTGATGAGGTGTTGVAGTTGAAGTGTTGAAPDAPVADATGAAGTGTTGAAGTGSDGAADGPGSGGDSGCGCALATGAEPELPALGVIALGLVAVTRRRRSDRTVR